MSEGDAFQELRPLLFSIAYRMVGSASEAEDLVQEAYLRFHRAVAGGAEVASPKAYLSAVTTRLAIDHLRSARAQREQYVGDWLPEPLVTGETADPAVHAETADTLSLAFLVLLERLSPVQRAVFLLHEVFGYGYAEIAGLVGRSEDNCRQIAARAGALPPPSPWRTASVASMPTRPSVSPWSMAAKNRRASSSRWRREASNRGRPASRWRRALAAVWRQVSSDRPTSSAISA